MDQDFDIEIVAVMGLECLEKHLSKCPIELELVEALSNTFVLKQNKVSEIAGFMIRPGSFGHHAKRVKSFNEVNNDIKDQTTNLYI